MWLMCALHYIIAAPLEKVCYTVQNEKLEELVPVRSAAPTVGSSVWGTRRQGRGGGGRRHSCLFFFHSLRGLSGAARHNHRRHRHQASFYFDYFYEFVDECTKPSGNLVNLALVNSFINVTGTIDNLKMQFNSTVGGLNLTQFAPDLSNMFGCVSCRACLCRPAATPAHARRRSARDVAEAHRYQAKCRHCV